MNRSIQKEYSFGDSTLAEKRLELLAEVFEPSSRVFLVRAMSSLERAPSLAVDLGSGPGRTAALVAEVLLPERVVGFDESRAFVESANNNFGSERIRFEARRLGTSEPFEFSSDFVFGRHLLAHVSHPGEFVESLAPLVKPGGIIAFEETFELSSDDALFSSYYEFVAELLRRRGQRMNVGVELESYFGLPFEIVDFRAIELFLDPKRMAQLHLFNLAAFRETDFGREKAELLAFLERGFSVVTGGAREVAPVRCKLGQIVARKRRE